MAAGVYNILIEEGATFERDFTVELEDESPVDYSTYTGRMEIRKYWEATSPMITLTTENGGITLGNGTVNIMIDATTTADLPSSGVYDLEVIAPGGRVDRLLQGKVTLSREITR
jgi:hypothetical protein